MRTPFRPLSESEFENLLKSESAFAYTTSGHGLSDINVFTTRKRRVGQGFFTNMLTRYGPKLIPLVKKYLFPATTRFASNVASDMISGEKMKSSMKKRGKESAKNLALHVLSGKGVRKRKRTPSRNAPAKRCKMSPKPVKKKNKKNVQKRFKKKKINKIKKNKPRRQSGIVKKKRGINSNDIFS